MKLLLLLIVLVGVFTANCRNFHDQSKLQADDTGRLQNQDRENEFEDHESKDVEYRLEKDEIGHLEMEPRARGNSRILKELLKLLKSLDYNMTLSNTNQDSKLDSIIDSNAEQDLQLDSIDASIVKQESMLNSIETSITNQDSKLDSIEALNMKQDTKLNSIENLIINQDSKLDSIEALNIKQDEKLNSINISIKNQNPKLNSIRAGIANLNTERGCPSDMFILNSTNQCFKLFRTPWNGRNWTSANEQCLENGLVMARSYDPYSLRKHIATTINPAGSCWLAAQGDGTSLKWQRDGWPISNNSPLWLNYLSLINPADRVSTNDYLVLETRNSSYQRNPNMPLVSSGSERKLYVICELVMNSLFKQV